MKFPLIFAAAAIHLVLSTRVAADIVVTLPDNGQARDFRIAPDELHCTHADGRRAESLALPALAGDLTALEERAEKIEATSGGDTLNLVLYEVTEANVAPKRRELTRRVIAEVEATADLAALAAAVGALRVERPAYAPAYVVFSFAGPADALTQAPVLAARPEVSAAWPDLARQQQKRFVPNDPRYAYSASNTRYQWHLRNTGQNGGTTGIDANVATAWDTYKGNGVRIGIVDDGLEVSHSDLAPNVDTVNDHDWNDTTPNDPTGDPAVDDHGTSCAGVAGARGNNGIGGTGAAPNATLVGLRLIAGGTGDVDEAEAFAWKNDLIAIYSNSWGPEDDATDLVAPGPLAKAAFFHGVSAGRGGRGCIYTWAGGNGLKVSDNSNYDGYANNPHTIAVAALGDRGTQAVYSEPGANLIVCAPSDDDTANQSITTTGTNGTYVDDFGGTSSATPLVSGCVALMLQANPNLGWRDVQEILIRSARKVSPADTEWRNNGAGIPFNHRFGAGMVNAGAATTMAATWTNLKARQNHRSPQTGLSVGLPDNNAMGVTRTFTLAAAPAMRIEHVVVRVTAIHPRRGDLEVTLTSPSGMPSILAAQHSTDTHSGLDWEFLSTRHWGEMLPGTWTVKVADRRSSQAGTLTGVTLDFFGTVTPSAAPVVMSATLGGRVDQPFVYQIDATQGPESFAAANLPPGLLVNSSTGILSGTPTMAGTYPVNVSATNGFGTGNATVTLTIATTGVATLANAVDAPTLAWSTPGASAWIYQTVTTYDGVDAARSAVVADSGTATLRTIIVGPGTLSFRWKVSSEDGFDFLRFFQDGIQRNEITGDVDWSLVTRAVPVGTHTYDWAYVKDASTYDGEDRGWVDVVTFIPVPPKTYAEWVTREFPPAQQANSAISGMAADPDLDGRTNLLEYALRSLPLVADTTGAPTGAVGGNEYHFTYTRDTMRSDVTLTPQSSQSLTGWTNATPELVGTAGSVQTWRVRFALSAAPRWLRLRVTNP